jgi:RecB family exonuclease
MYHSRLPRADSIFFKLGTAVHGALEYAGQLIKDEYGRPFSPEEVQAIISKYLELAAEERIEDFSILKDGQNMVMNKLGDFTIGRKIVDLENKFRIETYEGVPAIGAMDKIVEIDDETIGVIDYKTNKYAASARDLKSDMQLSFYDLAASIMYPKYKKIVLIMDYLRTKPVFSYRTEEERKTFAEYVKGVYENILETEVEDLKPNLNQFCGWCDYKTHCPKYAEAISAEDVSYKPAELLDVNDLIEEYDLIKNQKKIIETRERELKMLVAERIREAGDDLYGEDKKIIVKQSSRLNYDVNKVLDLIPARDIKKIVAINKRNLDNYLRERRPDLKDRVTSTATFTFNSPWFEVKAHDGGENGEED